MKRLRTLSCVVLLAFFVTACGVYKDNPVGFNYVASLSKSEKKIEVPTETGTQVDGIPTIGLGSTPASFAKKYGKPLPTSQPPTLYIFQAGLDAFPKGSVLVVSFDKSNVDEQPRAVQISFVAGDDHPTTINQAQAIAEGFFPIDTGQPTILQKQEDDSKKCLVKGYQSQTLSKIFPKHAFVSPDGGIAKEGTIAVNFFPLYPRYKNFDGISEEDVNDNRVAKTDIVSSILITLGTKTYC